jgi:exopolysaccharide biosynthesis WecB/TagA/CpsF family protein
LAVVTDAPTLDILGVRFACLDADTTLDKAEALFERPEPAWIAVENAHALNIAADDPAHSATLSRADMVLNDGKGVMLAAQMLGSSFPGDLNGNHFAPLLLERAARRGWRVFFFGAAPGVARHAADRLCQTIPSLKIVGARDGYYSEDEVDEVIEVIRATRAELLLVGLGMPLQERWLDRHLAATGARLGVTVGAFFDFQAGVIPRAPSWMNKIGLEWMHRLAVEPRRLWKRYLLGNPLFVTRVVKQKLSE